MLVLVSSAVERIRYYFMPSQAFRVVCTVSNSERGIFSGTRSPFCLQYDLPLLIVLRRPTDLLFNEALQFALFELGIEACLLADIRSGTANPKLRRFNITHK